MIAIGILGLGRMGQPIARRLLGHGFAVEVFDPDPASVDSAAALGATVANRSTDVAAAADVLCTVLPGRAEIDATMPAILDAMRPGSLWLDLTSGDPTVTARLAELAAARGIGAVTATMGGGPAEAASGSLTLFVGGAETDVDRVSAVLAALSSTVEHVGRNAADAQTVKLIANLLWFGQVVAVTEALLLGQRLGVSPSTLRRVLPASAGGSAFIDRHLDLLLAGDYAETFGLDRCVEELQTLRDLAEQHGTPFELSSLVTRLHEQALARYGAVKGELLAAKLLEEQAGQQLRAGHSAVGR
jgi:3-hydroxyisobutyrate dehydrogenase-like beta-hydroxyacid dehydrogenase